MTTTESKVETLLRANESYSLDLSQVNVPPGTPGKKIAILTCMDVRIDPLAISGMNLGDAHVIRNAGGRASDDAIRSLLVSHKFFGTLDWLVIQHTKCGMATVTDQKIGELFADNLQPVAQSTDEHSHSETECGSDHGFDIKWLTIADLEESVRSDVKVIAEHPLVSKSISIHALIYDVETRLLKEVEGASRLGTTSVK